jgi:D-alanyl-D-alanine carboxypeptidase
MTKNLKFFLFSLLLAFSFGWGLNIFEKGINDFFYLERTSTAFSAQNFIHKEPVRRAGAEKLEIEAGAAITYWTNPSGSKSKILFEKNTDQKLPIASLTKLFSAYVVLEYYNLEDEIQISREAAEQPGMEAGRFKVGEKFLVKDLLYPLLMESNNTAALALANFVGEKGFVELMNLEAENLGLKNTFFVNSTGLDPDPGEEEFFNYSTVEDLANFGVRLIQNKKQLPLDRFWKILALQEYNLFSPDGVFHHRVTSTNELLGQNSQIVGGKTGWTPLAGGCLFLVLKMPRNRGYLINVILNSPDRFGEMKKLIGWIKKSYR